MNATQRCIHCKIEKKIGQFKKRKTTGERNKRCKACCAKFLVYAKTYWYKHHEKCKAKTRANNRKDKLAVIDHYGGKCACCGESHYEFLSVDHIGGGGRKHRETLGSNQAVLRWLINNKFPDGYRLLCFNCNCALGFHGSCPHEAERLAATAS